MDDLNIMFLYGGKSTDNDAYALRLDKFKLWFEKKGCNVDSLYLKDSYFKVPCLFQPLNIHSISRSVGKFDIVHAGNTPCAYFMKVYNKFSNLPFIYDIHGLLVQEYLLYLNIRNFSSIYNFIQASIMEYFAKESNYFIACSEPLKEYYLSKGIDEHRIEVIRNGVDLDLFKPSIFSISDNIKNYDKFVVTYAGGFQKWQGIENLLTAAKIIINEEPNILFKIIGFKSTDFNIKKQFYSVLGNSVELINSLPRDKLTKELTNSDLLIIPRNNHPAISVALPTKFAEYIAIGKPVLVTRVDETSKFIEKYNCGFVCEPNPKSIAETIIEAKNTPNKEILHKGKNARNLAEKEFDQRIINEKYYNFVKVITNK